MTNGIRIYDNIELTEILSDIGELPDNYWAIFFLYAMGDLGEGRSIGDFENEIMSSDKGFVLSLNELKILASKFEQIIDITIVCSSSKDKIIKYSDDKEMYENFDFVIEKIDSSYWEIHLKDRTVFDKFTKIFSKIEPL